MRLAIPILSVLLLVSACATTSVDTSVNDARFGAIQVGMTTDQVRQALGAPRRTMNFPASSNVAWDYDGTDTFGYKVEYSVTFGPDQLVKSKLARRINDGGEMR
jgi:outer membrane protein assembly factor BamE (lipoprotein component of BamABCDE complex)